MVKALDFDSSVLQGAEIEQKFTGKLNFEKSFVWVDISDRTIHMSNFPNKSRRHKEANLSEVTSITAGPPIKFNKADHSDFNSCCLTINFKRGGGVDYKFSSEHNRNMWYDTLRKIVIYSRAMEAKSTSNFT